MPRILIIDDDLMSAKMSGFVLKKNGYETVMVTTGKQGIEHLKNERIDLVLLDIDLPEADGVEILKMIRNDPEIADTRVIFLTFHPYYEYSDITEKLGALDYIEKPISPLALFSRIEKALEVNRDSILIVDDDRMSLKYAKKMLEKKFSIRCASSGKEALSMIEAYSPDLVLLDINMPEMNGIEVLERIRSCYDDRIPVIMVTGQCGSDTEITIFKAGAMDFLAKPFIPEIAIQRIARVLDLSHLKNSLAREVDRKTAELSASRESFERLSSQIMSALSETIDAKDKYTKGHSARVAMYSRELAIRMGKSRKAVEDIYHIALLHDIGKIGISKEIINKPGKLTDEEFEEMKTHTLIGANILKKISEMPELSVGAQWHHERFDGRGYPDKLKGENIPELARIICVADSYDAMTSKRSYRDALSQDIVRSEIEKGKGTQFDPAIADIMLNIIDEDTDYVLHG